VSRGVSIAILAHAEQGYVREWTLARIAEECWAPAGHRIVPHVGLGPPPAADLAIQHVALTRVPRRYMDLAARYPRTVNGAVSDISKRVIATDLLGRNEAYDGPVMVKTDLNHAGAAERAIRRRRRGWLSRLLFSIEKRLPRPWFGGLPGNQYVVYEHKDAVPSWVWRYRGLVVQPLHVERRGDLFAMHQWYFLGDRGCVSTLLSHSPVVKFATRAGLLPLHQDVPDEIRRRRAELRFDFGKLDYVVTDKGPVLFDANHTPHEGEGPTSPRVAEVCRILAGGLSHFVG
jgi:hypothetical protein